MIVVKSDLQACISPKCPNVFHLKPECECDVMQNRCRAEN